MSRNKNHNVYELSICNEVVGIGTYQELADGLGITKQNLLVKLSQTKHGRSSGHKIAKPYVAKFVEETVDIYDMFKKGEFVATGTLDELAEETGYNKSYLRQLSTDVSSKNVKDKTKRLNCGYGVTLRFVKSEESSLLEEMIKQETSELLKEQKTIDSEILETKAILKSLQARKSRTERKLKIRGVRVG